MQKKSLAKKLVLGTIFVLLAVLILVIVIPNFIRARCETSANACVNNLRQIEAAKEQWALENGKINGAFATENDIKPYLKLDSNGNIPRCPLGGTYAIGRVGEDPTCSIGASAWPNDHVLNETNSNDIWINFKSAYSILLGLRHLPKP